MKIQKILLITLVIVSLDVHFLKPVNFDIFSVDFETSMGKYDDYLNIYYHRSLTNVPDWWRRVIPNHSPGAIYNFFLKSYLLNTPKMSPENCHYRVPKIFHQIWVGPKPFPEKYKKWQETWKTIPGWTYKLWTDKEVESLTLVNNQLYNEEKNMGARADILRMEILYQQGGVYIDTDFECIKPEFFDILNCNYDFYTGITPLDGEVLILNNGLIGSIPGHPILKAYIENLKDIKKTSHSFDIVARGPGLFTNMALIHGCKKNKDIFFPPTFFYPLAIYPLKNNQHFAKLATSSRGLEEIKKYVLKPESIAIHWWEGSWHAS